MSIRPIAFFIAIAAVSLSQTVATNASACCPPPEDAIELHFRALNAHDRAALLSAWNPGATVVSVGEPTLIEPIDQAATRWMKTKEPVTFHIDKIDQRDDDTATAHVTVSFEGRKIEDTIKLSAASGPWRIAGKTSKPVPATGKTVKAALRY